MDERLLEPTDDTLAPVTIPSTKYDVSTTAFFGRDNACSALDRLPRGQVSSPASCRSSAHNDPGYAYYWTSYEGDEPVVMLVVGSPKGMFSAAVG
jgi:hypothetical protein